MKLISEFRNLLSITCQYKSTSKPNEKYGTTMVWILLFISVKTDFSLYTQPAAKKKSGIWNEYSQLKTVRLEQTCPITTRIIPIPFNTSSHDKRSALLCSALLCSQDFIPLSLYVNSLYFTLQISQSIFLSSHFFKNLRTIFLII